MAVCEKCKTFYLNDECPTCKRDRLLAESAPAPKPAPDPAPQPAPQPAKKPIQRDVMSMSGWAGLFTFFGALVVILAVVAWVFNPFYSIAALISSMPIFCTGKLFKCITQILKNQDEILTALDRLSEDK